MNLFYNFLKYFLKNEIKQAAWLPFKINLNKNSSQEVFYFILFFFTDHIYNICLVNIELQKNLAIIEPAVKGGQKFNSDTLCDKMGKSASDNFFFLLILFFFFFLICDIVARHHVEGKIYSVVETL